MGWVLVITAEPEGIEATAQFESDVPAKKPALKGKGKRGDFGQSRQVGPNTTQSRRVAGLCVS